MIKKSPLSPPSWSAHYFAVLSALKRQLLLLDWLLQTKPAIYSVVATKQGEQKKQFKYFSTIKPNTL